MERQNLNSFNKIYNVESKEFKTIYIGTKFLFLYDKLETNPINFENFFKNSRILDKSIRISYDKIRGIKIKNRYMAFLQYSEEKGININSDTIKFISNDNAIEFVDGIKNYVSTSKFDIEQKEEKYNPLNTFLAGLFLIAGAIFLVYTFHDLETNGGSIRINWIFALIYKIGGKWIVASIFGVIGILISYSGLKDLLKQKKKPKK